MQQIYETRPLPRQQWIGRLMLLLLGLVAISGCARVPLQSTYQVVVPELSAMPLEIPCGTRRCTVVIKEDYESLVRELKAACIANGQSKKACQIE